MSKLTNLDINLAACLHNVHNLQHPTSRPTTKSTKTTMVNAPKTNFSPLPAGRYGKSKSGLPNDVIKQMTARAAWRQRESEPLGHCAAWDPKRSLRRISDKKRTSYAMKRKSNGFKIMWRERLLGQESELKMQRPQFNKSRTIWRMLK